MRHRWTYLTAAVLVCAPHVVVAQTPTILERVRSAMRLPEIVDSVRRNAGASESDVRGVLGEQQRRRMPASEAHDVLQAANDAAKEHGPVDNFGAFVQAQLASGLRGRALAQAIRAEHARRGKGGGGGNARASQAGGSKRSPDAASKGATKQAGGTTGAKSKGKGRP